MKTRKMLYTLLLIVVSIIVNAQDYKKAILADFDTYVGFVKAKNYKKAFDYFAPEFFEIYPKSELLKLAEISSSNNSTHLENTKVYGIADAQKIGNKYYSMLTYSMQLYIKVEHERDKTESDKQQLVDFSKSVYDDLYGAKNVLYNKEADTFEILIELPAYAVSDNGQKNWKFLYAEKHTMDMLKQLLPKEVFEKLKFK